jgi:hypothetical protein
MSSLTELHALWVAAPLFIEVGGALIGAGIAMTLLAFQWRRRADRRLVIIKHLEAAIENYRHAVKATEATIETYKDTCAVNTETIHQLEIVARQLWGRHPDLVDILKGNDDGQHH